MRRAATAAILLATVDSFPSDLLKDDCAKGVLLVDGGLLPPIMGIPPTVDETILRVVDLQSGDAVRADAEVPVGAALTLSFDQQRLSPKAGTQIVFVVSAGHVDDGLRCGPGGAQLQCSSCGETHGYLESTTWLATTLGRATLAIGAARGGYGTPAVRVGRMNVRIHPNEPGRDVGRAAQPGPVDRPAPIPRVLFVHVAGLAPRRNPAVDDERPRPFAQRRVAPLRLQSQITQHAAPVAAHAELIDDPAVPQKRSHAVARVAP